MTDTENYSIVRKVSNLVYASDRDLNKTGLLAKALSAAIESSPKIFTPNSLHCFFLETPKDCPTLWRVTETSSGNTFCHRSVKGYQNKTLLLSMNLSVTSKNSHRDLEHQFDHYVTNLHNRTTNSGTGNLGQMEESESKLESQNNSECDEDEKVIVKPFFFQTSFSSLEKAKNMFSLSETSKFTESLGLGATRIDYVNLGITEKVGQGLPQGRRGNFILRLGTNTAAQKMIEVSSQFVPIAIMLDPFYLFHFAKFICEDKNNFDIPPGAFSHAVYFHDVDFDCTQWLGLSVSVSRLVNSAFLLEADIFNNEGRHIATVVLEGLLNRHKESRLRL